MTEYGDSAPSNSGAALLVDKDELEVIRNQIKDVVNNNKEQQK